MVNLLKCIVNNFLSKDFQSNKCCWQLSTFFVNKSTTPNCIKDFLDFPGYSGQSDLMLQLFPMEIIVTSNLIGKYHNWEQFSGPFYGHLGSEIRPNFPIQILHILPIFLKVNPPKKWTIKIFGFVTNLHRPHCRLLLAITIHILYITKYGYHHINQ